MHVAPVVTIAVVEPGDWGDETPLACAAGPESSLSSGCHVGTTVLVDDEEALPPNTRR